MQKWFVLDMSSGAATPTGPFTLPQLAQMVGEGRVRRDTLVARPGYPEWIEAARDPKLSGLFGGSNTASKGVRPASPPLADAAASPRGAKRGIRQSIPIIVPSAIEKIRRGWNLQCVAAVAALASLGIAYGAGVGIEYLFDLVPERPSSSKALLRWVVWLDIGLLCAPIVFGMPLVAARAAGSEDTRAAQLLGVFSRFGPAILTTAAILVCGSILAIGLPLASKVAVEALVTALASGPDSAGMLGILNGLAAFVAGMAGCTAPLWLLVAQLIVLDRERSIPAILPILRTSWDEMWRYRGTWLASALLGLLAIALSGLFLGVGIFLIGVPFASSLLLSTYDWVRAQDRV